LLLLLGRLLRRLLRRLRRLGRCWRNCYGGATWPGRHDRRRLGGRLPTRDSDCATADNAYGYGANPRADQEVAARR